MQVRVGARETELTSVGGTGRRGVREHAVQGDPEVLSYRERLAARQVRVVRTRISRISRSSDIRESENPTDGKKKTDGSRSDRLKMQTRARKSVEESKDLETCKTVKLFRTFNFFSTPKMI